MSVEKQSFGKTKQGQEITLFSVTNKNGMVMKVTDFFCIEWKKDSVDAK